MMMKMKRTKKRMKRRRMKIWTLNDQRKSPRYVSDLGVVNCYLTGSYSIVINALQ